MPSLAIRSCAALDRVLCRLPTTPSRNRSPATLLFRCRQDSTCPERTWKTRTCCLTAPSSPQWRSLVCGRSRSRTATEFPTAIRSRSEEHTSELQSRGHLVCRLLLEEKTVGEE